MVIPPKYHLTPKITQLLQQIEIAKEVIKENISKSIVFKKIEEILGLLK